LHLGVEENLPVVNADGDALQQAILNLLTNAMKYSGTSREIDLRVQRQNGQAVIQVTDYGVGIAREEQAPIFENFYRVLTPESKLIPGTGLGLTLVAHVAKAHGGSVEVLSAPGEGSTFSIHLTLEDRPRGQDTERTINRAFASARIRKRPDQLQAACAPNGAVEKSCVVRTVLPQ